MKGLVDLIVSGVEFKDCLVIDEEPIVGYVSDNTKNESVFYSRIYLAEGIGPVYMDHNFFFIGYSETQEENHIVYHNGKAYFLGMGKGEWKND